MKEYFREPQTDLTLLPSALAEGKPILRTYWYDCLPFLPAHPKREDIQRYQDKGRFLKALENFGGWTVRTGHLRRRYVRFKKKLNASGQQECTRDGLPLFEKSRTTGDRADGCLLTYAQKGVDVAFAGDLLALAATRQITDAVLLTGDNDFLGPVEQCKLQHGIRMTLWFHPASHNQELRMAADNRRIIDQSLVDRLRIP
jgi:uncharacterized LabA/DUF88 family protein